MTEFKPPMTPTERHSAGASVVHRSPFSELQVPTRSYKAEDRNLVATWVSPIYLGGLRDEQTLMSTLVPLRGELNAALIAELLSLFDWRPRLVGAYLAAVIRAQSLTELIGSLLLRSDLCYAGSGYCLALARINSERSQHFLAEYLDYYLGKVDLWFDQASALAALLYLDEIRDTDLASQFMERWVEFIRNKPNWNLDRSQQSFREQLSVLDRVEKVLS